MSVHSRTWIWQALASRQGGEAVSIQRRAPRPAACKGCGETFDDQDLRLCAWSHQNRGQFFHIGCCRNARREDWFTAVGVATHVHVEEVRASLPQEPRAVVDEVARPVVPERITRIVENAWEDRSLPRRAFWEELSWESLLRLGRTTWVQVPDRLHSAVEHARQEALEALAEAREAGRDTEPEWKCALLLDLLLFSRMPGDASCAEALEERLAWWRGAQWEALWGAVAGPPTRPPTTTTTAPCPLEHQF